MASESSQSSSSSLYPSPLSLPSPSSGNNVGDMFKGSFISLTSNYGIRYEGILDNINIQDSTLGLVNVRSFGTEGRKKDGPQIPASDRVFSYILFRGSDIEDLKVKPFPSTQSRQEIRSDEDINQSSHYRPDMSSALSGYDSNLGLERGAQWVHTPTLNTKPLPATQHLPTPSSFQPPSANAGSLTESPVGLTGLASTFQATQSNNAGLPMLMSNDVQGNKSASTAVPLGPMQQAASSQVMDYFASPVMGLVDDTSHFVTSPPNLASYRSHPIPSPLAQVQHSSLHGLGSLPSNPSPLVEAQFSTQNSNPIALQAVGKVAHHPQSNHPIWSIPYQLAVETSDPAPVFPGQLLTSPESFSGVEPLPHSRQHAYASRDMVNMRQGRFGATNLAYVPSQNLATTNQAPWLPPPVSVQQSLIPSSSIEFSEEFNFEAMHEKFKKDELWGYLGKINQRNQTDNREHISAEPNTEAKPAYNKDDFFDTISCNPLNTQFPDRRRQDPEGFGDNFQREPQLQPGQGEYLAAQTNYRDGNYSNNYPNWGYYNYNGGRGRGRNTHF